MSTGLTMTPRRWSASKTRFPSPTLARMKFAWLGTSVARPRRPAARVAPGQMARHYSPRTPVVLHGRLTLRAAARGRGDAWLFLSRPPGARAANVFWLDSGGDLRRAARRLFAALRELDDAGFRRIHVERPAGPGIAEALRDRLARAAAA